eukprot:1158157-Pelagomonas_calceolata.AAC.3
MTAEDAAVLDNLPFSLNIPELGVVVVHAGIVPRGDTALDVLIGYPDPKEQHCSVLEVKRGLTLGWDEQMLWSTMALSGARA